jgi:hypothetical protein
MGFVINFFRQTYTLNSRLPIPPMPPPGQEGRGSYVWVPNLNLDDDHGDAPAQEQHDAQGFVDDIAEEDYDGPQQAEEEYIDPYAADVAEFPDGGDGDERGNSADEEEVGDVDDVGQNA